MRPQAAQRGLHPGQAPRERKQEVDHLVQVAHKEAVLVELPRGAEGLQAGGHVLAQRPVGADVLLQPPLRLPQHRQLAAQALDQLQLLERRGQGDWGHPLLGPGDRDMGAGGTHCIGPHRPQAPGDAPGVHQLPAMPPVPVSIRQCLRPREQMAMPQFPGAPSDAPSPRQHPEMPLVPVSIWQCP